ncbi:MAG TPA: polyprenyl synthetase family protein [Chloroflexota bacterium]|nr:polyprenyl synthetase family protein [Chloroflexota bacterium]
MLDLQEVLCSIRLRAVAGAGADWTELGSLVDRILPQPLNPMALLPIATGRACGGDIGDLIPVAAATLMVDSALRILDDCADDDNPRALHLSIGVARAANFAVALNAVATRELTRTQLPTERLDGLLQTYFRSFLSVCHGQDRDMTQAFDGLAQYEQAVKLKTLAAYEFAALAGGLVASADPHGLARCSECGLHLGWMAQILDDVEALWFPVAGQPPEMKKTFPALLGASIEHPNARQVQQLLQATDGDATRMCGLLDDMHVRTILLSSALDHRDKAIHALQGTGHPEGETLLKLWLASLWGDGARLLGLQRA